MGFYINRDLIQHITTLLQLIICLIGVFLITKREVRVVMLPSVLHAYFAWALKSVLNIYLRSLIDLRKHFQCSYGLLQRLQQHPLRLISSNFTFLTSCWNLLQVP